MYKIMKYFIPSLLTSFTAVLLYYYLSPKKQSSSKSSAIFFTRYQEACRKNCFKTKIPCNKNCSLLKLQEIINVIECAKETLDVCIYLITLHSVAHAIIRAHIRGVAVRIIFDEDMSFSTESKVSWFMKEGLNMKSNSNFRNVNMHHKFCIIDSATDNRKLLTGSANWTMQAFAGNYEYIIITSSLISVQKYQDCFDDLWKKFEVKKIEVE